MPFSLALSTILALLLPSPQAAPAPPAYVGLGRESVTPEALARYAPPPLPPGIARRTALALEASSPESAVVAPDGQRLFFDWPVTGNRQVWRMDGPERLPVQLTGGSEETWPVAVTPDGATLIVQRDRKGEECPGLYSMSAEGGPLVPIQHLLGVRTLFQLLAPDGKVIYFVSNDLKRESYTVYRYDLATRIREAVYWQPGLWGVAGFRPDSRLLLRRATAPGRAELFELDPATRKLTPAPAAVEVPGGAPSLPKTMPPELPADALAVTPLHASGDGRFLAVAVQTARAPRALWVLDTAASKATRWLAPRIPEVDPGAIASGSAESFTARDGTKQSVTVWRPPTCRPEPCPVVVHLPETTSDRVQRAFSPEVQLFVASGFVVVEPEPRGGVGYGRKGPSTADRLASLTDLEDLARNLRTSSKAGGSVPRIGIVGTGDGGYAASLAMTRFAGAFDAGASLGGISSLPAFLQNTSPDRRPVHVAAFGDPEKEREVLDAVSPLTHAGALRGPLLLVHGVNDPDVPAGESIALHEAARGTGAVTELILLPDEGHGARQRANRILATGHLLRFLQVHLRGDRIAR